MTSGPAHYVEAERLCDAYKEAWVEIETMPLETVRDSERRMHAADAARQLLTKAGIHAQLALAAASALPTVVAYTGDEMHELGREWTGATA